MEKTRRELCDSRFAALQNEWQSWYPHVRDVRDHMFPWGMRLQGERTNDGSKKHGDIFNNRAELALRTFASGMMSGLTSPARPWFNLLPPDPGMMDFGNVSRWLHTVREMINTVFAQSNLYTSLHGSYRQMGAFGNGPILVIKDFDDVIRCIQLLTGEYYLAKDHRGRPNALYREFKMTVGQIAEKFGKKKLSQAARALYDNGAFDKWVEVRHCIEPNDDRRIGRRDNKNFPFRSVYYEKGSDRDILLEESGFKRFPAIVPQWMVMGTDVYARSPGMEALGDVKQLQNMEIDKSEGVEKMVRPPMVGAHGMEKRPSNILAGGVTYVPQATGSPKDAFYPAFQVNLPIHEIRQDISEIEYRISRAFYEDLFLMLAQSDRRQITAREIDERREEKLLSIGPVIHRLDDEYDHLIDLTFHTLYEAGALPPPPSELQGAELKVEYVSVLHQAQRAVGVSTVERFIGFVGQTAAVAPQALDKVDIDQAVDEYGTMIGVPPTIIRKDEDVEQLRAQRAQAEQQAQAIETAPAMAKAAKDASETELNDNSILAQYLEGSA